MFPKPCALCGERNKRTSRQQTLCERCFDLRNRHGVIVQSIQSKTIALERYPLKVQKLQDEEAQTMKDLKKMVSKFQIVMKARKIAKIPERKKDLYYEKIRLAKEIRDLRKELKSNRALEKKLRRKNDNSD